MKKRKRARAGSWRLPIPLAIWALVFCVGGAGFWLSIPFNWTSFDSPPIGFWLGSALLLVWLCTRPRYSIDEASEQRTTKWLELYRQRRDLTEEEWAAIRKEHRAKSRKRRAAPRWMRPLARHRIRGLED